MAPTSQTAPVTLRLTRTFAASREKVFRAWADPEALKRWAGPGEVNATVTEVDLRVGGRYRIHMQAPDGAVYKVSGVYQAVEPPRRLVYTWSWETGPDQAETLVTVEFLERGDTTEVIVTHDRFPDADARDRHEHGWSGCMVKFSALLAGEAQGN